MKCLTPVEVNARKVAELGLDPNALDLESTEAIAGALRRSASFLCPCASSTLTRSVVRPLQGLVENLDALKGIVESTLDDMIAHGDILEQLEIGEEVRDNTRRLLYTAPPSFVSRQNGGVILLGIATDQLTALPDELASRIEYISHIRRLYPNPGEDLKNELIQLGLIELIYQKWLKSPRIKTPKQCVSQADELLSMAPPSYEIQGLSLLDPTTPVRFYPGRWVGLKSQTGRFVGRRAQDYGADLWCYIEIIKGNPVRLLDLPLRDSRWRGCDDAWRLQAAIDYERGAPQVFRIRTGSNNTSIIDFFSPIPMWAKRRLEALGEPSLPSKCLFSYKFEDYEIQEEIKFFEEELWLSKVN